jgi:protein TonB
VAAQELRAQEAAYMEKRELLTTLSNPEQAAPTVNETPSEAVESPLNQSYEALAREIASLEARIARERQALAKAPRVKRLTSVSTKTADEAAYLNMWRQKVERIGNANFPPGRIYGDLRMLVVINWDGKLKDLRILESSGLEIIRTWKFSRTGASLDS